MPSSPLSPCAEPRCTNLVAAGRCALHSRQAEQRRGTAKARGYGQDWKRARLMFLRRYPLCGLRPSGQAPVMSQCHDDGRLTPAQQVDHVTPHKGDRRLFWDADGNWQSLCGTCHSRKTQAGL